MCYIIYFQFYRYLKKCGYLLKYILTYSRFLFYLWFDFHLQTVMSFSMMNDNVAYSFPHVFNKELSNGSRFVHLWLSSVKRICHICFFFGILAGEHPENRWKKHPHVESIFYDDRKEDFLDMTYMYKGLTENIYCPEKIVNMHTNA